MREEWDVYTVHGEKTGRTAFRGDNLEKGEYHLVVSALIKNSRGQYLISRRSVQKSSGSILETVGGSAVKGDDSLSAILREVNEELGLKVDPHEMKFLKRLAIETQCSVLFDLWTLNKDVDLNALRLQSEEVSEVMWMAGEEVKSMIINKTFFNHHVYQGVLELGIFD